MCGLQRIGLQHVVLIRQALIPWPMNVLPNKALQATCADALSCEAPSTIFSAACFRLLPASEQVVSASGSQCLSARLRGIQGMANSPLVPTRNSAAPLLAAHAES